MHLAVGWRWALAMMVAGCSVADVGPEMGVLSKSVSDVEASLAESLAPRAAAEHRRRVAEIAAVDGYFGLTPECAELLQATPDVAVSDCAFETVVPEGATLSTYEAEAVTRKLRGLRTYVDTLAVIAGTRSEDEILAAYAGLTKASGDLAAVTEVPSLRFVSEGLEGQAGAVERAVRSSVGRIRIRTLREITREYDPAVQQLAREARAILLSIGHDPRYRRLHAGMTSANARLQTALLSGDARETARRALEAERAHRDFVAHARRSDYAKLSAIARAHGALTRRLQGTAPRAEAEEFVASIRELAQGL